MRDLVTTALDAAGLISIALGVGVLAACAVAAVWHDRAAVTLGMLGAGCVVGGLVLTFGSVLAARRAPAHPAGDGR